MPGDELFGPVPYSWWWAALGAAILLVGVAAVVLWVVLPRRLDRPAAPGPVPPQPGAPAPDPVAAARADALTELSRVRARHDAGELDARAVHQAVAATLRRFAGVRLGRGTEALTVRELDELDGMTRGSRAVLRATVAPSFGTQSDVDAADAPGAIADAERLVGSW